jgi:hypothetical protein
MTSAKVIQDSITTKGYRLTTLILKMHRFILPELSKHRVFSFNTSSSRAIPVSRQIKEIKDNDMLPVHWGKNIPGMKAWDEVTDKKLAEKVWRDATSNALDHATQMQALGVHKQVTNRLLEPFMETTMVLTSTDFDNFFRLRCHKDAQPEIQLLANLMREAIAASRPTLRATSNASCMHLPFVTPEERVSYPINDLIVMSTARNCRVSYNNHYGKKSTLAEDRVLHNALIADSHDVPLEHIAIPIELTNSYTQINNDGDKYCGNFKGFSQYRHNLHWSESTFTL